MHLGYTMGTTLRCSTFSQIGKISNPRQIFDLRQYLQYFLFVGRQNLSAESRHLGGLIHHRKMEYSIELKIAR